MSLHFHPLPQLMVRKILMFGNISVNANEQNILMRSWTKFTGNSENRRHCIFTQFNFYFLGRFGKYILFLFTSFHPNGPPLYSSIVTPGSLSPHL